MAASPTEERHLLIRSLMEACGRRGNPRDYVVLFGHRTLRDYDGDYQVSCEIPPDVEAGAAVYVTDRSGKLARVVIARVESVKVEGKFEEHFWVSNGKSETLVARADCFALPIPMRPVVVHKSLLHDFIGAEQAARFWNRRLGVRVTAKRPARGAKCPTDGGGRRYDVMIADDPIAGTEGAGEE